MKFALWQAIPKAVPHEERPALVERLVEDVREAARIDHPLGELGKPMVRFFDQSRMSPWTYGSEFEWPEDSLGVFVEIRVS